MLALRFHAKRDLRVERIDHAAHLQPHEVRVRTSFCGICGTDLHEYLSGPIFIPAQPHPLTRACAPQVLGHEFSGRIVEVGASVTSVKPGDRVSIQPLISPPDDFFTLRGQGQLANNLALVGLSWPWGGMAEEAVVPEGNVARLPDGVSDEQGAMIEPAAVVVHAVDKGRIGAGHSVLVTGAGPIGALACLAAAAAGATTILVSETNPKRRARVRDLGVVTESFDPAAPGAAAIVAAHTEGGNGVDVALECVGHERALATCIESVRRGGTIVQVGLMVKPGLVDVSELVMKDITLEGCFCYETTMWPRVIGLVASGKLPVERVLSAVIGIEDAIRSGFDVLTEPGAEALKILIKPNA